MVTRQGVTREFDMDTISALVAGSFAATKEMARLLRITLKTVEKHRDNIRKKFKISNKNINLSSFLQSL